MRVIWFCRNVTWPFFGASATVKVGVIGAQFSGLKPAQMYIRAGRSAITGVRRVSGVEALAWDESCASVTVFDVGADVHPARPAKLIPIASQKVRGVCFTRVTMVLRPHDDLTLLCSTFHEGVSFHDVVKVKCLCDQRFVGAIF